MQAITAPPQFVRSLLEGAKLRGYDAGEILIAEGLPAQIQDNQRVRISTKQFAALTTRIIQMLDDEACGQLERRSPPGQRTDFCGGSQSCALLFLIILDYGSSRVLIT